MVSQIKQPEREWWPLAEVAKRWSVSVDTVARMLGRKVVRGKKFGRQWRIHVSELERRERGGIRVPKAERASDRPFRPSRDWFPAVAK